MIRNTLKNQICFTAFLSLPLIRFWLHAWLKSTACCRACDLSAGMQA